MSEPKLRQRSSKVIRHSAQAWTRPQGTRIEGAYADATLQLPRCSCSDVVTHSEHPSQGEDSASDCNAKALHLARIELKVVHVSIALSGVGGLVGEVGGEGWRVAGGSQSTNPFLGSKVQGLSWGSLGSTSLL